MSGQVPKPTLHTPYDGSSQPFTIGLAPLVVKDWIEVDDNLAGYLAEKHRLYAQQGQNVLVAEAGSEAAQQEVLDLLVEHLLKYFPEIYSRVDDNIVISAPHSGEGQGPTLNSNELFRVKLDPGFRRDESHKDASHGALARAALLVQEDLVLMRKSPEGWRLVAASLCFPSAWNLLEKFRKPLHDIHKPVPGFGEGTRNAALIERMFDNLKIDQPVLRWNWSLHDDAELYHPHSNSGPGRRFGDGDLGGKVILRIERQTLRKLEISGDILFAIRIHVNPLEVLETRPEGPALARAIDSQLRAMSAEQANYKGITDERQRLSDRLSQIAKGKP